jgi:hypothetical protein
MFEDAHIKDKSTWKWHVLLRYEYAHFHVVFDILDLKLSVVSCRTHCLVQQHGLTQKISFLQQVRGVGAGGIISTAFCLLYKLFTLRLTRKQLNGLINHTDSPYIRGLGFMYIRYVHTGKGKN